MARARNIKPSFFTNDDLAELEPLARLLFISLWTLADKEGRLEDKPKKIKVQSLPYDECDCDSLLSVLNKSGFILRYEVDGNKFIQVSNFLKHQNPHCKESASTIPAPCKHGANTGKENVIEDSEKNNESQSIENKEEMQAPEKHGASTVQASEKHQHDPADSLNLIPDSLNLIPDSLNLIPYNTQSEKSDCYIFSGEVIKLKQKHYDDWKKIFPYLDLDTELKRLDIELAHERPKNWFVTVSNKLNYQNGQKALKAKGPIKQKFSDQDYGKTEVPAWAKGAV